MKKAILTIVLTCAALAAAAQTESFLSITAQRNVFLPGSLYNLSVVDGILYGCSDGLMISAHKRGDYVLALEPDTLLQRLDHEMTYVVRRPGNGPIVYTKTTRKHGIQAFEQQEGSGLLTKIFKTKQIKIKGWKGSIEHPVFSMDNQHMVFASTHGSKFGGYDLFFTRWNGKSWSKPRNLGIRINTASNEIDPCIYGPYLLFSSERNGAYRIYATRLFDDNGNIILDNNTVQRLPSPINSGADDWELAIDAENGYGYWVTYRNEKDELFSYKGRLDGVMIWGQVTDRDGNAQANTQVTVSHKGRTSCNTTTDDNGYYTVFLKSGQEYELLFEKEGFFSHSIPLTPSRKNEDILIAEEQQDIELESMAMEQEIYYENIFGKNADIELSANGIAMLAPLMRFLLDNPTVKAEMTLTSDITADKSFNKMLTARRIMALRTQFFSSLPETTEISYHNGCENGNGCSSGSGKTLLSVKLSNSANN